MGKTVYPRDIGHAMFVKAAELVERDHRTFWRGAKGIAQEAKNMCDIMYVSVFLTDEKMEMLLGKYGTASKEKSDEAVKILKKYKVIGGK